MSLILLDVSVVRRVYRGCLPRPCRGSVWSLRRDQAALRCVLLIRACFGSLPLPAGLGAVLGTEHTACPGSLGHSVCTILFVLALPWCFLALLSLLDKANLLVVCVHREHPLTQSPSWLSGEQGRVILDLFMKLRHSP